MKKFLCILLAALLCLPLLVACGKKDETPAADNTQAEGNADASAASAQAAAQQADKAAIAEAFNGAFSLDALKSLVKNDDGETPEQGEETISFVPAAMIEAALASAEAMSKSTDAEVKFDFVFFSPIHVLFSLQNGVLYGNVNGEPAWISLNEGVATVTAGLPLATESEDLLEELLGEMDNEMLAQMADTLNETEVTEEQMQAVIDMLPALTAADLTAAEGGVYVLTDDYITRFVIAVMNATSAQSMPAGEMPAEAAAQQAEAEAAMKEQIGQMVTALGIKIGFKLTGTAITGYYFDFEATEATVAAVNAFMMNMMNSVPADQLRPTGAEEAEEEEGLKVGTRLHLALTVTTDGLPTALELGVTVPDVIGLSADMSASYADKVVTGFTCTADVTLFANEIDEADVNEYDDNDFIVGQKQAVILADTTVHATMTFDPSKLSLEATGEPLHVELSVAYANVQHLFDGRPVVNFEGLEFADEDAEMEDPQNASFTLASANNGQGLIRFAATATAGEESEELGALDVRVGSAPNYVTPEESPYTELSNVVTRLMTKEDIHGRYAYTVGADTYYFNVYGEGHQNEQGEWEYEDAAELDACLPATDDAPYDGYTIITVVDGELVLTPAASD